MKELYQVTGSGNSSGLKIFKSLDNDFVIKVPKLLVSRSWRFLGLGVTLLVLSILIPVLVNIYIKHFLIKMAFFAVSSSILVLGGGLAAVATWEIRSAIVITMGKSQLTVFHPAFFKYRSLTREYKLSEAKRLYVIKGRRIGREKYSLMMEHEDPLDERLIKGFYVAEQALWIASEINSRMEVMES